MKRQWTHSQLAELSNLYHIARTALAGTGKDTPYHRHCWAAAEYHKAHPEVALSNGVKGSWAGSIQALVCSKAR